MIRFAPLNRDDEIEYSERRFGCDARFLDALDDIIERKTCVVKPRLFSK